MTPQPFGLFAASRGGLRGLLFCRDVNAVRPVGSEPLVINRHIAAVPDPGGGSVPSPGNRGGLDGRGLTIEDRLKAEALKKQIRDLVQEPCVIASRFARNDQSPVEEQLATQLAFREPSLDRATESGAPQARLHLALVCWRALRRRTNLPDVRIWPNAAARELRSEVR